MRKQELIQSIQKRYKVKLLEEKINRDFINTKVILLHEEKNAPNLIICFDGNDELSLIDFENAPYHFKYLNRAEYPVQFLIGALDKILNGNFEVQNSLAGRKKRIAIKTDGDKTVTTWTKSKDFILPANLESVND